MPEKGPHHLLLLWLIFTGLLLFALVMSWHFGFLNLLYEGDRSRISWLITLLYIFVYMHCFKRILVISGQINSTRTAEEVITATDNLDLANRNGMILVNHDQPLAPSPLADYIHDLMSIYTGNREDRSFESSNDNTDLIQVYESRLKSQHDIGWFLSDIMIKLGLLGTIVGFVLMLGSVVDVTDFDVNTMQSILKQMSSGMGTALYTTFAGLICSMLTAIQYQMLDRGAEEILDTIKHLSQVYIIPRI